MIRAGIIGGAGYTAGELLRILVHHPEVDLIFVQSESQAGKSLTSIHTDLLGDTNLSFSSTINEDVDTIFVCSGHGKSKEILDTYSLQPTTKIIDLSNDFRLKENNSYAERLFTYGLPEANKTAIKQSTNIANPGCFATAIQLGLLPLFQQKLVTNDIHINAITGSTGAGQSLSPTTHFTWRNNNVSVYKAFTHQHLGEIGETFVKLQQDFDKDLNFIPVRGNFTRGIFSTAYTSIDLSLEKLASIYETFYKNHPFTHVSSSPINLKQVVNTNKCLIHLEKHGSKLLITSVIDNLVKGASGQAVHNMNLLFGLEETTGLQFKPAAF